MTTLNLHIGLHKTGTTSLQSFFAENDEILKQFFIIYPRTGREEKKKHKLIACSLRSVEDLSRLLTALHEECSEHLIRRLWDDYSRKHDLKAHSRKAKAFREGNRAKKEHNKARVRCDGLPRSLRNDTLAW